MLNLTTLEVRWFSFGEAPLEVKKWYESSLGELSQPETREDRYLKPNGDYFNLKLRQGNLELKWRQQELGCYTWGDRLEGKVERWQKWTCPKILAKLLPQAGWITVQKRRSQRHHENVSYELTQLTVQESAWWSLAFEAQGSDFSRFTDVVSQVSQTYPGPNLLAEHSCAYPHWLASLS